MTSLKHFLEACTSPVGVLTVLMLSGLLLVVFRRKWQIGKYLIFAGAALYLFFSLTPFAEVLYANLENSYPPMLKADARAKTVVVLSGYGENFPFLPVTSQLGVETVARLTEGIRLYREIPGAKLILSGGVLPSQDVPISRLMADFARSIGVPDQDIVIETSSTTTYENLLEVKKIVGSEPFILVTSSVVLRRAVAVARKLGMTPLPAPAAIRAARYYRDDMSWKQWILRVADDTGYLRADRLGYLQAAYHEYLGYFWYWLNGRI